MSCVCTVCVDSVGAGGGGGRTESIHSYTLHIHTYSTSSLCHPDCFLSLLQYIFVISHNSIPFFLSNSECSFFRFSEDLCCGESMWNVDIFIHLSYVFVATKNVRTSKDRQKCKNIRQGGRCENAPAKITNKSV
jgi:hypothetical protein